MNKLMKTFDFEILKVHAVNSVQRQEEFHVAFNHPVSTRVRMTLTLWAIVTAIRQLRNSPLPVVWQWLKAPLSVALSRDILKCELENGGMRPLLTRVKTRFLMFSQSTKNILDSVFILWPPGRKPGCLFSVNMPNHVWSSRLFVHCRHVITSPWKQTSLPWA